MNEYIQIYDYYFFIELIYLFFIEMEKEGEWETSMCGCLLHAPYWGPVQQPRACALTGNQTGNPLVHRPTLNPLNYTSQCSISLFLTATYQVFHIIESYFLLSHPLLTSRLLGCF